MIFFQFTSIYFRNVSFSQLPTTFIFEDKKELRFDNFRAINELVFFKKNFSWLKCKQYYFYNIFLFSAPFNLNLLNQLRENPVARILNSQFGTIASTTTVSKFTDKFKVKIFQDQVNIIQF